MEHVRGPAAALPSKRAAALVSVGANILLIGGKLLVGLLTGSVAILADAAHSFLDLSASIFAYIGIRAAEKPADEHHAWGHGKAENVSSLVQMFLLGATCIAIVIESVRRLVVSAAVRVAWYSFAVVVGAMVVDLAISRYLSRVSRAHHGSAALDADALHFFSDLWASLAALVGISLVAFFAWRAADPLAGMAVALIIGATAMQQGRRTTSILLDAMPDQGVLRAIERILATDTRISGFHSLRARQAGTRVLLDVCVHVDGRLELAEAHAIGHAVSDRIQHEVPAVSDAVVHVEPAQAAHG